MDSFYRAIGTSKQSVHQRINRKKALVEYINYLEVIVRQVRRDHPQMALRTIHDKIIECCIGRDRFEHEFKAIGYGITRSIKPTLN